MDECIETYSSEIKWKNFLLKIYGNPKYQINFSILNVNSRYNYEVNLRKKLAQPVVIVPLLNGTVMQGSKGAVGNVTLPAGKLDGLLL